MGGWLYYNFVVRSLQIKKLCSRLYLTEIEFYFFEKQKNSHYKPPFGGPKGNIPTLYEPIAHWKAHS